MSILRYGCTLVVVLSAISVSMLALLLMLIEVIIPLDLPKNLPGRDTVAMYALGRIQILNVSDDYGLVAIDATTGDVIMRQPKSWHIENNKLHMISVDGAQIVINLDTIQDDVPIMIEKR